MVAQPNIASRVIKITALLKEYKYISKTHFYSSKVVCSTNAFESNTSMFGVQGIMNSQEKDLRLIWEIRGLVSCGKAKNALNP